MGHYASVPKVSPNYLGGEEKGGGRGEEGGGGRGRDGARRRDRVGKGSRGRGTNNRPLSHVVEVSRRECGNAGEFEGTRRFFHRAHSPGPRMQMTM